MNRGDMQWDMPIQWPLAPQPLAPKDSNHNNMSDHPRSNGTMNAGVLKY